MQKIFSTVLFLLLAANLIFAQETDKSVPIIISKPSTDLKTSTSIGDLIGLEGQTAPGFSASSMDGTEYKLDALRGKIVVINLWGTFCAPCITEMPKLNALTEKYKNRDVVFLAPAVDDKTLLEGFLLKYPFKYQVLPNSFGIIRQYAPKKKTTSPNDKPGGFVMLLPTHLVINRDGTVVKHFWGFKDTTADDLLKTIEQLLASPAQTTSPIPATPVKTIGKAKIYRIKNKLSIESILSNRDGKFVKVTFDASTEKITKPGMVKLEFYGFWKGFGKPTDRRTEIVWGAGERFAGEADFIIKSCYSSDGIECYEILFSLPIAYETVEKISNSGNAAISFGEITIKLSSEEISGLRDLEQIIEKR
jgi:peroxiredoxin